MGFLPFVAWFDQPFLDVFGFFFLHRKRGTWRRRRVKLRRRGRRKW